MDPDLLAFGERLRAAGAAVAPDIPAEPIDAGRVFDAVIGQLPPEEVAALARRMVDDAELAEQWRLARNMADDAGLLREAEATEEDHAEADRIEQAAAEPEAPRDNVVPLVIGAVLAAAAGLSLFLNAPPRLPDPETIDGGPVYRGDETATIASPLDGKTLGADRTLRWNAVAGATGYRVEATSTDLRQILVVAEHPTTELPLTPAQLSAAGAGGELMWRVEATLPDGSVLRSGTFRTRVP